MVPSIGKYVHSSSSATTSSSVTSPDMISADYMGPALWEKEGVMNSIMFPYVRDHAYAMIARIQHEDPRAHYVALQEVHDVCLYKRTTPYQEMMASSAVSPLETSLSSSFSLMASSSRRNMSMTRDQLDPVNCNGDFEFRGITRIPGTVETVLNFLASESARENYWVALNTLRDVKAAALLSSARLQSQSLSASSVTSETDGDAIAFSRWSRKYMATQLSKQNAQVLDCCYAEYAAISTCRTENSSRDHSRLRGFVYRRSVSERALSSTSSVSSEPLAKARVQGAVRFYIRDWLFDVMETQEPQVCKLVLTCTMFVPQNLGQNTIISNSAFREFCTEYMVGARRALIHQWKDHAAHAGPRSSMAWRWETRSCAVCLAQFSLLRKRHTCCSCGSGVCSKCCQKSVSGPVATDRLRGECGSSVVSGTKMRQRGSHNRECLLCTKFGSDGDLNPACVRQETIKKRHLSASVSSMSVSISQGFVPSSQGDGMLGLEQEDIDQAHSDLALHSTASISGSRGQRHLGSFSSQRSMSGLDDVGEESAKDIRSYASRLGLRAETSKLRTDSAESNRSSHSASRIVLLSDLETLTLSGSFYRSGSSTSALSSVGLEPSLPMRSTVNARMPPKSAAPTPARLSVFQRQDYVASVDDLLSATKPTRDGPQETSATTEEEKGLYSEDDLANFTLELVSTTQ